ncbi:MULTISPECIES: cysteine-rich CWC family protein [Sporosarcina]|uniref:cysteine-rich CWC family protein n=1 Tax=Sporosarcina TaxID=1569 RepID=UPI000A19C1E7|nr:MULTISPECIES: cysteine-rich CWC family protein [Sporosarcina]PIC74946.1 hypothetical protein CSV76_03610 [Sporosarcina sp. P17b]
MITQCPICQGNNKCSNLSAEPEICWCTKKVFTDEVFRKIPEEQLYKQCICERCLHRITEIEKASKGLGDR